MTTPTKTTQSATVEHGTSSTRPWQARAASATATRRTRPKMDEAWLRFLVGIGAIIFLVTTNMIILSAQQEARTERVICAINYPGSPEAQALCEELN